MCRGVFCVHDCAHAGSFVPQARHQSWLPLCHETRRLEHMVLFGTNDKKVTRSNVWAQMQELLETWEKTLSALQPHEFIKVYVLMCLRDLPAQQERLGWVGTGR